MTIELKQLTAANFSQYLSQLAALLVDGVQSGASISFIQPFDLPQATDFWQNKVLPAVTVNDTQLIIALQAGQVVGSVQLQLAMPPNQAHRSEIAKLVVDSKCRRQGVGRLLMKKAIELAKQQHKSLITLDTRSGDPSQRLYQSLGFIVAGEIPQFALDPDGSKLAGTTYMYKLLS